MLLIRYRKDNQQLTAWCADEKRFERFVARDDNENIVILDIPIPDKPITAWLYDETSIKLIPNPDYREPSPIRNLPAEIDELKTKVAAIEGKTVSLEVKK